MALDPNVILQMIFSQRAQQQRAEQQQGQFDQRQQQLQQQAAQQRGEQEFQLGLKAALDPDLDTKAFLNTFQNLSPARAELLRSLDKAAAAKRKTAEATQGAGAAAAVSPLQGGAGGQALRAQAQSSTAPNRNEVLESLRAIQTQATGRSTPTQGLDPTARTRLQQAGRFGAFPPEAFDALAEVDRQAVVSTRKARAEQAKSAAEQTAQRFDTSTDRRKEFSGLSKDFIEQRNALSRVEASAKEPSPAGDLALIFNYMKVLDPGSVVRESEFATAAATGSFGQRIQAAVNRIQTGERLTAQQRQDFLNRARMIFKESQQDHLRLRNEFQRIAKREGLSPSDVVLDFTVRPGRLKKDPVPPPARFPDATFLEWGSNGNPVFLLKDGRRFEVTGGEDDGD